MDRKAGGEGPPGGEDLIERISRDHLYPASPWRLDGSPKYLSHLTAAILLEDPGRPDEQILIIGGEEEVQEMRPGALPGGPQGSSW
ncbi:hypothetical protein [Candidatus Methanocrinis natronophilus]|uniref:Uncharacterized protein n=1 Tax=Candidatus Methanocrinis natronophilus TaxID=3033396 RepID=A0ABT5X8Y7_9EURY|nr:hypothetical protein [Candidatus Methanocrinis natronophilus]MDF0591152.1 hypothetical protein [Candidatus Methanocrinis natronophilus]